MTRLGMLLAAGVLLAATPSFAQTVGSCARGGGANQPQAVWVLFDLGSAQVRGDNTGPHTIENSFRKAYTARTTRAPSGALVDRVKADPNLGLVHLTNVIATQGALPIKVGDDVIGAVGASGAPGGEKDEACVKAGLDKVADQLK